MDRATDFADTVQDAATQIDTGRKYHAFIDKSRRKPYICGICGRDIKHPSHQPPLPGMMGSTTTTSAQDPEPEEWKPTREESQLSLF